MYALIQKRITQKHIAATSVIALVLWIEAMFMRLSSDVSSDFYSTVYSGISIIMYVLWALYINVFHKNLKATALVPAVFAAMALQPIWDLFLIIVISRFSYIRYLLDYGMLFNAVKVFVYSCVVPFIEAAFYSLAAISALKGIKTKKFAVIAMAIGIFTRLWYIIFSNLRMFFYADSRLYAFGLTIDNIAFIILYASVLFFSVKYTIPPILKTGVREKKIHVDTPEEELEQLKKKFECGVINEETYNAKRAEIISKL